MKETYYLIIFLHYCQMEQYTTVHKKIKLFSNVTWMYFNLVLRCLSQAV